MGANSKAELCCRLLKNNQLTVHGPLSTAHLIAPQCIILYTGKKLLVNITSPTKAGKYPAFFVY
jgi:hypothetical protein